MLIFIITYFSKLKESVFKNREKQLMYKEIIITIRKKKIKISINFKKAHRVKEFYKVKNKNVA